MSDNSPSPGIASLISFVVLLGYSLMQTVNVLEAATGLVELLCSVAVVPVVAALHWVHSAPGLAALRGRILVYTLSLQALITFVPFIVYGWRWGGMGGFLAASVLHTVHGVLGRVLFALVVLGIVGLSAAQQLGPVNVVYMGVSTLLTGLVLYALARLAALATAIHGTREELARMAVARERLRFARDLHDLLGYSLSSIALKNELIQRIVLKNPELARREVEEVLVITRQALADVREVARGYRDLSLLVEVESACSVLRAAGITVTSDVSVTGLPSGANTLLATVLREGLTNILRHSQPSTCVIATHTDQEAGTVELRLVNDGAGVEGVVSPGRASAGTGLGNLTARVGAVGGRLNIRRGPADAFELVARVPLATEAYASVTRPAEARQPVVL
ncbi:sensor histidine kinase [Streptomyces hydrogenans]|uniref:sensor histidine kinase n=1 Tax=Streptomyces hydrogenans TaxID=1873719 RepID=UPI0033B38C94